MNRAWAVQLLDYLLDDPDAPSPTPVSDDLLPQTTLIKHALAAHMVIHAETPAGRASATSAGCCGSPSWGRRRDAILVDEAAPRLAPRPEASTSPGLRESDAIGREVRPRADQRAAGLGMVEIRAFVTSNAGWPHQIGMFKRSGSDRPVEHYSRLPKHGGDSCDIASSLILWWPRPRR